MKTASEIVAIIKDRLSDAERDEAESHKTAMNSYGAGYDSGFASALREVLHQITDQD